MARSCLKSGNVIWLGPRRLDGVEAGFGLASLAAFLAFMLGICLASDLLSQAIVGWMARDRSVASSFILATGFL